MTIETSGLSSSIAKMALDASMLRHRVIANNIANAKTIGYKPQTVEFEKLLSGNLKAYKAMYPTEKVKQELMTIKPTITEVDNPVKSDEDSSIHLDQEIAKMTSNIIHYQALIAGLGKRGSILKTAITGGR